MNATRVERPRRPSSPAAAPGSAAPLEAGEHRRPDAAPASPRVPVAREPARLDAAWIERVVLVVHSFARERAESLLDGLSAREHEVACAQLDALAVRTSPDRQARVAQVFGPVPEAAERLRSLMAEASPPLQAELLRRLPPYYRSLFPGRAAPRADGASAPLSALAERLLREAIR